MNPATITPRTVADESPAGDAKDAALVARIRAGDQHACEQIVREHGGRMLTVARRFFRCESDAADAVQDAFLSAFQAMHRFEGKSALSTWLHRVVVNACLMKLRRHRPEESIEPLLPQFKADGHHATPPTRWDGDPASLAAERAELRDHVRACIAQLPETYRSVLLLRDIEEFDTAETARLLNCTPNNVKVRLHRARQALRTLLVPTFLPED